MKNIEEYIYHFGLDHLEIYGTFKDEDFMNSELVKKVAGYDIERIYNIPKYLYKIIFKKDGEDIFVYYKGMQQQSIPTKDYIVIYSTGFKLVGEEEIKYFLLQFKLGRVKRFDIAVDLLLDIDSVLSQFNALNQRGATFNGPNGDIETQYIGDKKKRNKRQLIRIYDKIKDTQYRKKNTLYKEYLAQDHVTRVELEIRSELARNRYYEYLFDIQVLLGILKNYFAKHTNLFESLPGDKITLFEKKDKNYDPKKFQSTIYRYKRNKIFLGHAKSIFEMGYCPVRMLLGESLIQENTKRFLDQDIVERIGEIEIELKRDELIRREKTRQRRSSNYKKNG